MKASTTVILLPSTVSLRDPATGSAMRVLASYWQQRGLDHALTALQRSAEGGLLFSRIEGGITWIGGNVSTMEMEDTPGE